MIELLSSTDVWIGFLTLVVLEIVLGIDNIVFISILAAKLRPEDRARARTIGLSVGVIARVLLLLSLTWVMKLTTPLFTALGFAVTGKGLILILGGLFLVAKSTLEIHHKLEGAEHSADGRAKAAAAFSLVIAQIVVLDVVFALDSVITAVGMVGQIPVMIAAVLVAVVVMIAFAGPVSDVVERHPTLKMLALSFLVLIGANLIAEGFGHKIPKGYTYFAMAFSFAVELLNLKLRGGAAPPPVHLRDSKLVVDETAPPGGGTPPAST